MEMTKVGGPPSPPPRPDEEEVEQDDRELLSPSSVSRSAHETHGLAKPCHHKNWRKCACVLFVASVVLVLIAVPLSHSVREQMTIPEPWFITETCELDSSRMMQLAPFSAQTYFPSSKPFLHVNRLQEEGKQSFLSWDRGSFKFPLLFLFVLTLIFARQPLAEAETDWNVGPTTNPSSRTAPGIPARATGVCLCWATFATPLTLSTPP